MKPNNALKCVAFVFLIMGMLSLFMACSRNNNSELNNELNRIDESLQSQMKQKKIKILEPIAIVEYTKELSNSMNNGPLNNVPIYESFPVESFAYVGNVETNQGLTAYILASDKKLIELKIGDKIGNYRVKDISKNEVTLMELGQKGSGVIKIIKFKGSI